uniref:KIB1-4 beta-propeller domain-containing protein n=1 Tax=Oryza nivara TaxID=4536 RepID=A0A0E0I330_ORYNI
MGRSAPPSALAAAAAPARGGRKRKRHLVTTSPAAQCAPSPRDPTLRKHLLRPRAWVALCDGDAARPDDACEITFFHTRTARSLRVRLPELRCHRIVGFTDGLIILLHKRTTAVRVLNPFTGVAVDLPPLAPVFHQVVKNRNSLLYMLHQRHVSDDPHCRHRLVPLHGWSARL